MKKKNIKKYLIIISCVFSSIFCILGLILFALINVFRIYFDKEKIDNYILEYNVADIINIDSEFISDNLNNLLDESGLEKDIINDFINSEEFNNYKNEIVNNILFDIFNDKDISFMFESNKLEELIFNNIPELSNKVNEKVSNKIRSKIPIIVDKLNLLLNDFKDRINNSNEVKIIKNYFIMFINIIDYILIISIIFIVLLIINIFSNIILMKDRYYNGFKYLFSSFIVSSVILYLLKIFALKMVNIPAKINDLINLFIVIYFIIGVIILFVYCFIIFKIKRGLKSSERSKEKN